ncbi:Alpha/Beta hydrolase protein [Schizophyllum amplum]|uniref:Alpha/Beta hydrolase protein n=1 Tax=Schizophyllum amplum TaxID=97359 RepID=A0A550C4S7_9AGAR|nr:Alpha/Beta hydrolase protein [Auriculariopsis ampla]
MQVLARRSTSPPRTGGSPGSSTFASFIPRAHRLMQCFALAYGVLLCAMLVPYIQTMLVFGHGPLSARSNLYATPEAHGLAPGKAQNLRLDGRIGAWLIMSDAAYGDQRPLSWDGQAASIQQALNRAPTILYLHGNSGDRATDHRCQLYSSWTSRVNANMFAIDYRGFGDSEGSPTVAGVLSDARVAWDFLLENGAKAEDILIMGQSLGTGIATLLVEQLEGEHVKPRGLVLLSPFTSLSALVVEFKLGGVLPILRPLMMFPFADKVVAWMLQHKFETISVVPYLTTPTFIAHAADDPLIPLSHSEGLFDAIIKARLGPEPRMPEPALLTHGDTQGWRDAVAQRRATREAMIKPTTVPNFGTVFELSGTDGSNVVLLKTHRGGHAMHGVEGVQDVVREMFDMKPCYC